MEFFRSPVLMSGAAVRSTLLPLFPLNTVVFPGAKLTLRVFEDRYKDLVRDIQGSQPDFVIALIRRGKEVGGPAEPFRIGTVVRQMESRAQGKNATAILIQGLERVRLDPVESDKAYPQARVTLWPDPDPQAEAQDLVLAAKKHYDHLVLISSYMGFGLPEPLNLRQDVVQASYALADQLPSSPRFRQTLLTARRVEIRLRQIRSFAVEALEHLMKRFRKEPVWQN